MINHKLIKIELIALMGSITGLLKLYIIFSRHAGWHGELDKFKSKRGTNISNHGPSLNPSHSIIIVHIIIE